MTDRNCEQALAHHVRLWLDNDEGLYLSVRDIVAEEIEAAEADQVPVYSVAERLQEFCAEVMGLDGMPAGMASELLTTALAFIDWRELATDYIEEA